MGLTFHLLGPPTACRDGRPLPVPRGRQNSLLRALLVSGNRVVAVPTLVDELWGESAPPSAVANLRSYVNRLRTLLDAPDDPANTRLVARDGGYLLHVAPDELDVAIFERLVAEAHAALTRGATANAVTLLEQALAMWPDPTPGPAGGPLVTAALDRLLERRLWAAEEYFACRLRIWDGDIPSLADAVRQHLAAHPLRERAWAQLMTLLYRTGDLAGALEAFHQARRVLKADLGISPGEELCRLQRAILRRSPDLLHPRQRRSPGPVIAAPEVRQPPASVEPAPHEVPDVAFCVGRERELARLSGLLHQIYDRPACLTLYGTAGIGKSILAARAAGMAVGHFPDGQLYLDLDGSQPNRPPLPPDEITTRLLRSLTPAQPPGCGSRARLRSLLYGRRILIVLDNAVSAVQVAGLLPARGGCALLVTSRAMLTAVDGVHLRVGRLSRTAAVALLGHFAGARRVADESAAAMEIVEHCDRLPLAVRIAGARLAQHPHRRLADLACQLRDERRRLDVLTSGTMSVRASLAASYAALGEGAELFRRLGWLRLSRLTPQTVGALLDVDADTAAAGLDRLADAQLIEPTGSGGYLLPRLTWLYAAELAAVDPPALVEAARRRIAAISGLQPDSGRDNHVTAV